MIQPRLVTLLHEMGGGGEAYIRPSVTLVVCFKELFLFSLWTVFRSLLQIRMYVYKKVEYA